MTTRKTFIAATRLEGIRLLAFQGIQAIACHSQFTELLEERLSPQDARFLAEPLTDPAGNSADWYTPAVGDVHRLSELPPEQAAALRERIATCAARIQALADKLKKAGDSNSRRAGSLLDLVLSYPSEDCLYAVGEQPVLIGWGCAPGNAAATPEPLVRIAAGIPALPEPVAVPPPLSSREASAGTRPALSPSSPSRKRRRGPWPWWILFFLLGFLLCALFAPLVLPYLGLPSAPIDVLPSGCRPAPMLTPVQEGFNHSQDRSVELRRELEQLLRDYAERLAACPPRQAPLDPPRPEEAKGPPEADNTADRLEIPEAPTTLAFLEGCWMAGEEMLINQRTGLPIAVKYCFDSDGAGEALVQQFDAKGKKTSECRGTVTASLTPPDTLIFDDKGTVTCPDGGRYERTRATCTNKNNVALCSRPGEEDIPFTRTTR